MDIETAMGFSVDRSLQEQFCDFLEDIGLNNYGSDGAGKGFENETFIVRPYYWGDCDCDEEHVEGCPVALSNFEFKPTQFYMDWYKYPLRGAVSSEKLTRKSLTNMIEKCLKSVGKGEFE